MDETEIIYKLDPCSNIKLNTFRLNWDFFHHDYDSKYCEKTIAIISLGQFICENVCLSQTKNGLELKLKSRQVLIIKMDSILIRLSNTYLATPRATVHGHFGEIFFEGDILIKFIYEKSRSGKRVDAWNEHITKISGIPWGFFLCTELTIVKSRISLVNKIQRIYRSQGVHNIIDILRLSYAK
ncbi:hypothetical protein Ahy_B07g086982 isoform A [Arachis hypogaea]|uniref:Uncharacterized protein n=1 Tax=Arachis hypogaea TaxID=3818 RepID=A0A444YB27_ARAHY|nr:hypothetical protein Ahy_B07g086982 isoform A [Arachis hypogaea]